jgi:hypothetical protein
VRRKKETPAAAPETEIDVGAVVGIVVAVIVVAIVVKYAWWALIKNPLW